MPVKIGKGHKGRSWFNTHHLQNINVAGKICGNDLVQPERRHDVERATSYKARALIATFRFPNS